MVYVSEIQNNMPEMFKSGLQKDERVYSLAGGAGSRRGTGGMKTKLQAASLAVSNGADVIIANGKHPEMIYDIVKGGRVGTLFVGKAAE